MILTGEGAVQSGIGLHDFDIIAKRLVNVHSAELWLIKAGLELITYDHNAVLRLIECNVYLLPANII